MKKYFEVQLKDPDDKVWRTYIYSVNEKREPIGACKYKTEKEANLGLDKALREMGYLKKLCDNLHKQHKYSDVVLDRDQYRIIEMSE